MSEHQSMNEGFTPPRHWIGVDELSADYWSDPAVLEKRGQEFHDKPVETIDLIDKLDTKGIARRDFLTIMGASMAMASFACARRPVHKIIPYVVKPEEITGGVANYYATTCPETAVGMLAKVREGRPIKLEGNPDHPMSGGGALSARQHAAILDLYDMDRAKEPRAMNRGKSASSAVKWEDADAKIVERLRAVAAGSGRVRVLSSRIASDSTQRLVNEFLGAFAQGAHVQYDGLSLDEIAEGQNESYGTFVVPHVDFEKADVVLSLGADFLGTWVNPVEYSATWGRGRKLSAKNAANAKMSKLFVVESMMTVTGAASDVRMPVRPGDELKIAAAVAVEVAKKKGVSVPAELASYDAAKVAADVGADAKAIAEIAEALWAARGRGAVVAGGVSTKTETAVALQVVANWLNSALDNEGKAIDGSSKPWVKTGSRFADVQKLVADMNGGLVDVLVVYGANPMYQLPKSLGFCAAAGKVPMVVAMNDREDETAQCSDYLLPIPHFLENWGDSQARKGVVSLQQPALAPIHDTRAFQDSLLAWTKAGALKAKGLAATIAASEKPSWHDYLKANWKENYLKGLSFDTAWENALRDGVIKSASAGSSSARGFKAASLAKVPSFRAGESGFVLAAYDKVGMGDGRSANNPWLQEFPDPITTATWDNYVNLSPAAAKKLGVADNDVVEVSSGGEKIDLPVNVQVGLHPQVVAIAIGYGRTNVGKVGNGVGRDVKVFGKTAGASLVLSGAPVQLAKTGRRYQIAVTQWHNASENRPIINDITLAEFKKNPAEANETDPELRLEKVPSMWPKFEYKKYRWGMAIDLTACTGCGACVIACQSENNIPVVGRDNVRRSREMHWLRLDRYYSGDESNPDVVFQPMLCQHCENAPCETVCPVLATVHDDEGLNVQVYNRCVGTRYCQNNCPYKVRRFNFFDHWKSYEGTMTMAWNPDISVRTRGIMEKCTFCVQRIRDAKDHAKDEGRIVKDGDVKTACQQTCPVDGIVFGNLADPESRVSKLREEGHAFRALEALNTGPAITYLSKVRNKEKAEAEGHSKKGKEEHHA